MAKAGDPSKAGQIDAAEEIRNLQAKHLRQELLVSRLPTLRSLARTRRNTKRPFIQLVARLGLLSLDHLHPGSVASAFSLGRRQAFQELQGTLKGFAGPT